MRARVKRVDPGRSRAGGCTVSESVTLMPTPDRRRGFLALVCWIVFWGVLALALLDRRFAAVHVVATMISYAAWNVREGRKWYGVFLLFVPLYGPYLVGKMFWSWAGSWTIGGGSRGSSRPGSIGE